MTPGFAASTLELERLAAAHDAEPVPAPAPASSLTSSPRRWWPWRQG